MSNPTSGTGKSASTRPKMVRELKFNLHDSVQRKSSESFGKIKEAIITKIYLEFDNTIEIVESLKVGTKIVFVKPKLESSISGDECLWRSTRLISQSSISWN